MKIAIVTHDVVRGDGQGRVSVEIARYGLQNGAEVFLVADRVAPELLELGAKWVEVHPKLGRVNLSRVWEFARLADTQLDKMRTDLDIIQCFGFSINGTHHVNNSQYVHDAWGASPVHTARLRRDMYGLYQHVYTVANKKWEKLAFGQARHVVASSHLIERQLRAIGVSSEKMSVIHNGVDLTEFYPGSLSRKELNLPETGVLALFAGDIRTPRKNLETVLRALVHAPDLQLAIAGRVAGSPYPALAEQLGVADRAHFLDFRRDIAQIMRAVDFFVFPSRYEACSLVILESLSSGLPTVSAETAGGAELISESAGVVLQNPDDVERLAAIMRDLSSNPSKRESMGRAAREVAEQHSWTRMAEAYFDVYRRVAGRI